MNKNMAGKSREWFENYKKNQSFGKFDWSKMKE